MRYTNCSPRRLVKHSYKYTCTWLSTHAGKQQHGWANLERESKMDPCALQSQTEAIDTHTLSLALSLSLSASLLEASLWV